MWVHRKNVYIYIYIYIYVRAGWPEFMVDTANAISGQSMKPTAFLPGSRLTIHRLCELTDACVVIAYAVETVRDRANMYRTNLIEREISQKKAINDVSSIFDTSVVRAAWRRGRILS